MRGRTLAAIVGTSAALIVAATCQSTKTSAPATKPAAAPTATPMTPTPPAELPPGTTPLPVRTPSSSSAYDREPGVLYEETRPAPPTPAVPTPRPPRTPGARRATPRPTPTAAHSS